MTTDQTNPHSPQPAAEPLALRLNDQLGQALEDAAYECMSELAGVDTHDVNLRDHPQAWAAIEAFAAKVKGAERERCAVYCDSEGLYQTARAIRAGEHVGPNTCYTAPAV